jgi:porphobilinogen synthase
MSTFPLIRMRRMRRTTALRDLVREHRLHPSDFILPLFVQHGSGSEPIEALPGHERVAIDRAVEIAQEAQDLGVGGLILFGIPSEKDDIGSEAYDDEGIVQLAVRAIKRQCEKLVVMTDVCLCQYTSHGHCGVVRDGEVLNDVTLELLAQTAVSHAQAGADVVAPSDMMDGRVGAIRAALDQEHLQAVGILSYSAKYASAFYGPFREAAGSTPQFGDRRAYQMDPANVDEAIRESLLDVDEGADMLMVKPALPYLDVITRVKEVTGMPLAAYHVSGEYAMVKAAAANGWIDERAALLESLTSIKRAGADVILTYASLEAARWIKEDAAQ